MESRKQRELEFHNTRFEKDPRGSISTGPGKFYLIFHRLWSCYQQLIGQECEGKRVLEYGCGTGSYAFYLARKGAVVTGIDISDVAVRKARQQALDEGIPNIDFRVMDAEKLDFQNDQFDLICGTAILHHLDLRRAFGELARVMKPGGRAIFVEPLGHNPLINLYRKLTPQFRTVDEHPLLFNDFQFARSFFSQVGTTFFHLTSIGAVPLRNYRLFPRILQRLHQLDVFLFRHLPFIRRYAWDVILEFSLPRKSHHGPVPAGPNRLNSPSLCHDGQGNSR